MKKSDFFWKNVLDELNKVSNIKWLQAHKKDNYFNTNCLNGEILHKLKKMEQKINTTNHIGNV